MRALFAPAAPAPRPRVELHVLRSRHGMPIVRHRYLDHEQDAVAASRMLTKLRALVGRRAQEIRA